MWKRHRKFIVETAPSGENTLTEVPMRPEKSTGTVPSSQSGNIKFQPDSSVSDFKNIARTPRIKFIHSDSVVGTGDDKYATDEFIHVFLSVFLRFL